MELTLFKVSQRYRKSYKDSAGVLYLECTKCKSVKTEYNFIRSKHGFLGKHSSCCCCRNKQSNIYRKKKAYANNS